MRSSSRHSLWPWLTAALFAWVLVFQAARLYATPLAYDDAYLAAAAKSLAFGYGYATHYPSPQPFDVRLGVGLALQLPAASLIALLGNKYWVPGLATALAIDFLIIAVFSLLRRRLESSVLHRVAAVGLATLMLLTAAQDEWMLSHWYAFLGDIPAALTVILAILLLSRDLKDSGVPAIGTGTLMGLALNVKLVTALAIAPAVLAGLTVGYRSDRPGAVRKSLLFGVAALLPTVLVQVWALVALGGPTAYLNHFGSWQSYLASEHSGAGLSGVWAAIYSNGDILPRVPVNGHVLIEYLGGPLPASAVLALIILVALRLKEQCNSRQTDELPVAGAFLCAAFAVHTGWWVVFSSTGWINHLLPAFGYLTGALAFSVAAPARPNLVIASWTAATIVALPRLAFSAGYLPPLTQESHVRSALEVRDLMTSQRKQGEVHLACGWWVPRDLEYLLPGVGNFRDCFQVDPAIFQAGRPILVRNLTFWNWEKDGRMQAFADSCDRTIVFRNEHYVLSRCANPPPNAR